ncbi:MAG: GAF domain-containing protein [Chloroflexi bacterium]|nr:GAF domain-containing protein [Chloroflexota bacterium]
MTNGDSPRGRILIVDDIPDTVKLLKEWLESHNFRATGVTSSVQALELAEQQSPDLILLDVMMPKMDGIETCRRLKANPKTAGIPVILVTAKNPGDARSEGMMAGAIDYITKPINLNDLVRRIEAALATTPQSPVDVQRLLEEVAHSAMTILQSSLVWLLALDDEDQSLASRILVTTSGSRAETDFLLTAGEGQAGPRFPITDSQNPLCVAFISRQTLINQPIDRLDATPSTRLLAQAARDLRINYLTIVPLTAAGKTSGVMALGSLQPHNMDLSRAQQILSSLGSQAAIALDYSRLILNLTQREQDMEREQAFREMMLDTMSDGLVVIDDKGIIRYVNRRMLRMTNHPKGYLEGRSVGELFHEDDRAEVMLGLLREGIATMKFEQRLITRENRVIPVWLTRSRAQSDVNSQVIVLSDITQQKNREQELERQTSHLQALNRAAHVIASNVSLHETLQNILNAAVEVVEAQGASLFLLNKDNPTELIGVAAVGSGADIIQGVRVPVGQGVAGWVAREAQPQLVADITKDPRYYRDVDEKTGLQTRSLIAVPLINAEQVIGVIEVVNKHNNQAFDENDLRLLESMAGTAAISVVNARLFDESQRRVRELGMLLKASGAASSTLQFAQVLESIVHSVAEGLGVARCVIMAWNAPKNQLEALAEVVDIHWPKEDAPRRSLAKEPLNRAALASGLPVFASAQDVDLVPDYRASLEETGMANLMVAPLWVGGAVAGLADLYSTDASMAYSDKDVSQFNAIVQVWQSDLPENTTLASATEAQLGQLVQQLMAVGKTCWVTLRTWTPGEDHTVVVRERGFAEWTTRPRLTYPMEKYPTMQAVIQDKRGSVVTLDKLANDPAEAEWIQVRGGRACLMVPLIEHGTAVGIVKLVDRDEHLFDEDSIRLAQGIANVVSSATENARLYQSLESRARALESAYRELQEADKAKDEFIQNVSHELRTPLISVLGYAGLLADGTFGPVNPQQQEALAEITRKAQKLADLVDDIVSVQALENQMFECSPADLRAIVREVVERCSPQAAAANLQIVTTLPDAIPSVLVDARAVGEAVEKLLDNALKFGAGGEKVEVTLQDTGGPMVQVAVRDYGIGIDATEQQKIFRRFYQVDGGTARRYPGTGLGLAIARAIIEGHGGRIGVKSKLNEGATFIFTLPKTKVVSNGTE